MKELIKNMTARVKIISAFAGIFIVGFIINFAVTSSKQREEAIQAVVLEAQELTLSLEKVRIGMGEMFTGGFYDMDKLLSNPDQLFLAVPVVRSLMVGEQLAAESDYSFKAPSFNPRNPANAPTPFEADLLTQLDEENLSTIWAINEETNSLHFLRSIVLDETCMGCHGLKEESLTGTLTDPLGYTMEGWRPGDSHGAFEFIMPLEHVDASIKASGLTSAGLIFVIVIGGMAALFFMIKMIFQPLTKIIEVLPQIEQGDLTIRLDIDSKDEFGTVANLFDSFLGKLHNVISSITTSAGQVDTVSTQVSTASEELAAGSEEQQAQLSEVATTMEEMSAMILSASDSANTTRTSVQITGATAKKGRESVTQTVRGFRVVATTVEKTANQIKDLNLRSEDIGNVIQVIEDIADQTNLLALNANIEAARAGDAGRGFAVVADEVRKLAERTVTATAEISKMIMTIQTDIRAAVDSMDEIQSQSKEGLELVEESDKSLEEISDSIVKVVDAIEEIATSSTEQSSGAEQISKNIEGVATVAKESANSAQNLASSAEQLTREVQELNELMSQFKI